MPGATVLIHDRRRFLVLQIWLCDSQPPVVRRPLTVAPTSRTTASGQPLMPSPHPSPKRTLAPSSHGRIPRSHAPSLQDRRTTAQRAVVAAQRAVVARPSHGRFSCRPSAASRVILRSPLASPSHPSRLRAQKHARRAARVESANALAPIRNAHRRTRRVPPAGFSDRAHVQTMRSSAASPHALPVDAFILPSVGHRAHTQTSHRALFPGRPRRRLRAGSSARVPQPTATQPPPPTGTRQ